MKIVGYLRVSTREQAEEGYGLAVQEAAVKAWARKHSHRLVAAHRDEGVSGSNGLDTRIGLADALAAVRTGAAEGIVVPRLDRLARDLVLQETLLAEVCRLGGQVFSTSDGEAGVLVDDAADPSRKLIRQILGAVSEYERSVIALRMRGGRERKRAAGGYAGHGAPPFGFEAVGGELVPVEAEQRTIARARALRSSGLSLRDIGDALTTEGHSPKRGDQWHPQTLARILGGTRSTAARVEHTAT